MRDIVKVLPTTVTGYKSPYPTVVSDTVAQYRALKKFLKVSGSTLYTIKADTKNIADSNAENNSKKVHAVFQCCHD